VWGVGLSLILGLASTLLDQNNMAVQVALVAMLAGTAVALLVDQYVRFDDIREDVRASGAAGNAQILAALARVNPIMQAPEACQVFAAGLVDDWQRIEHQRGKLYQQIFEALQHEFVGKVHDLAEGRIDIDADCSYSFHRQPLAQFRSMRMVHSRTLDYWDTAPGRRYLHHQQEAISAGELIVERIFVLDRADLETAAPIVKRHLDAQIQVGIVVRDEVIPSHRMHLLDQGVITDDDGRKILVRPIMDNENGGQESYIQMETLSDKPRDIATAESSIDVLSSNYAREVSEIYPAGFDVQAPVRLRVAPQPAVTDDHDRRVG
jgi:hypothetical protein